MNRSDRGKIKEQIASEKQAVVQAGKEQIELDDDSLRVPSHKQQQMGKDLAVCTLTLQNNSLTDFNYFIQQDGRVSTPSIYECYSKDFCYKKGEYNLAHVCFITLVHLLWYNDILTSIIMTVGF